jgi:aspartate-semialdehyde dehydrogenase
MVRETKKIMGDESIAVAPTTVRVPVRTGHSESINLEFHQPITVDQAKAALSKAPGIVLLDGYAPGQVPTPLRAENRDEVFVGRIRKDPTIPNGLQIWVVADNLRKGAATNAVQIAEELIKRGIV